MASIYDISGTSHHSFKIGDGPTFYYGNINPTNDIGVVGDIYILTTLDDTSTSAGIGNIYIKSNRDDIIIWREVGSDGGSIDLSNYVTWSNLYTTLSNYANKTELPTLTSQLTNDSGFITEIPAEYVTETELDAKGYLTEIPAEYVTETELESKGYLTEHQDISGKADVTYVDEQLVSKADIDDIYTKDNVDSLLSSFVSILPQELETQHQAQARENINASPNPTIESTSDTDITIIVTSNTIYNCQVVTSLTIDCSNITNINDISDLYFTTSDSSTINLGNILCFGDDVINNVFTPIANKRYNVMIYHDGLNTQALIHGYSISSY